MSSSATRCMLLCILVLYSSFHLFPLCEVGSLIVDKEKKEEYDAAGYEGMEHSGNPLPRI